MQVKESLPGPAGGACPALVNLQQGIGNTTSSFSVSTKKKKTRLEGRRGCLVVPLWHALSTFDNALASHEPAKYSGRHPARARGQALDAPPFLPIGVVPVLLRRSSTASAGQKVHKSGTCLLANRTRLPAERSIVCPRWHPLGVVKELCTAASLFILRSTLRRMAEDAARPVQYVQRRT